MLNYIRGPCRGGLLLFIFSFLYLSLFYRYGLNLWDEGNLLSGALRSYRGEVAVVDFLGYPPGRYSLSAFLFHLFGVDGLCVRWLVLFMTALAVALLYRTASYLMPFPFSLLPPMLFLVAPSLYYNRFFPIFTIFNLYGLVRYFSLGDRKSLAIFSAIGCVTLFFKQEIALVAFGAALSLALFCRPSKKILFSLLAGALGGLALFAFYVGSRYLLETFRMVFTIHDQWGTAFPSLWTVSDGKSLFETLLFYIPPLAYGGTLFYLLKKRGEPEKKERELLFLVLFMGVAVFGLVIWRAGFDNLIRVLPPLWLAVSYLLYRLHRRLTSLSWPLFLRILFLGSLPLFYGYQMIFSYGFYVGSIGALRGDHALLRQERLSLYAHPAEARWVEIITTYIRENSTEEDSLLALPLNGIWNFLGDRVNPLYHEWILPGVLKNREEEIAVVERLKTNPPKIVILSDIAIDGREDRRFSRYAPLIYEFIRNNYTFQGEVGLFQLWDRQGR